MNTIPSQGDSVRIVKISYPNHAYYLGKIATVKKYIKSRKVVLLTLPNKNVPSKQGYYEAHIENLEPVDVPTNCPHPPTRLYSWTTFDGSLAVCCCDCGEVLKG